MPTLARTVAFLALVIGLAHSAVAQDPPETAPAPRMRTPLPLATATLKGLELRPLGPCITPGRIGDIAVDPKNRSVWYVAMASGGVWKTTNRGITWKSIFDNHGSYSMGCITIDPKDSKVVWLGTGENQSQRSVGFGDGVYKSIDGGSILDQRRAQELRAHRQDPDRPARFEHRLRRFPGPALERGGRPRCLQDSRRRQDVGARTLDLGEYRRHRSVHGPARSGCALRRGLSAAAATSGCSSAAGRSRPSTRPPTAARRGRNSPPACPRRTWAASRWRSLRRSPTWSTLTSRRRPARTAAASSAPRTAARTGRGAAPLPSRTGNTTAKSSPTRTPSTASTSWTSPSS